jgi:hypothetical protein
MSGLTVATRRLRVGRSLPEQRDPGLRLVGPIRPVGLPLRSDPHQVLACSNEFVRQCHPAVTFRYRAEVRAGCSLVGKIRLEAGVAIPCWRTGLRLSGHHRTTLVVGRPGCCHGTAVAGEDGACLRHLGAVPFPYCRCYGGAAASPDYARANQTCFVGAVCRVTCRAVHAPHTASCSWLR